MDDNLSNKSSDSLTTSGEYEIVPETPTIQSTSSANIDVVDHHQNNYYKNIEKNNTIESKSPTLNYDGDFLDLKNDMTEVIQELDKNKPTELPTVDLMGTSSEYEFLFNGSIEIMPLVDYGFTDIKAELMDAFKDDNYKQNSDNLDEASKSDAKAKALTLPLSATTKITSPTTTFGNLLQQQQSQQQQTKPSTSHFDLLTPKSDLSTPDINRVGHSIFYDCIDLSPQITVGCSVGAEKQDDMKPEKSETDEEMSDIDQGCTIFNGVTYLGSVNINTPKSEKEIQMRMSELNMESKSIGMEISISIPMSSDGLIVLYEKDNSNAICRSYEISRILFYARGPASSDDEACFAFTWSHGESVDTTVFQCHVFRCHIPEAVNQVSTCFSKAFQRYPTSLTCSVTSNADTNLMMSSITLDQSGNPLNTASYDFVVTLSIGEKVAKESYSPVPRDRSCFKLRCNIDKEVCITVKQTQSDTLQPLLIERCFGVLLSPGKLVRQADMQLLDIVESEYIKSEVMSPPLCPFQVRAQWNTSDKAFGQFNYESQKMFLTVAVDLVIKGIQEPVRFIIETPCTIMSQNELRLMDLWISNSKRSMSLRFYLQLKKTDDGMLWQVDSIDPSEEIIEQSTAQSSSSILKSFTKMVRSASTVSIEDDCPSDYSSDGDEPLLSGTGEVSKDCSQDTLDEWDPVLKEWDDEKRPKQLPQLVRAGVPEALRGKIWQKLANVENKIDITDMYRTLITKETKCEAVILRDIHRTFPAHKRFKESGGSGQDALFKVSKAYAVYDKEVGYCQGLSFIAASLLIHMPEEDAFTVLVAIMYDYSLRDLYKQGFENLYLRLYQLNRLIKDYLPKLHEHFERTGIETHMYASQWFLTLFTARFSLHFVFHVLDVFLLDGMPFLFQIAITLLALCESDLRQLDFEGILKYFRVALPKKFRSAKDAKRMIKMACERKVKKLKQYEEEFCLNKKNDERLERETKLYEEKFRDERIKYKTELNELQLKLDEIVEKGIQDEKRHLNIVNDYKQIIQRQEQQITKLNGMLEDITKIVSKCKSCSTSVHQTTPIPEQTNKKDCNNKADSPTLGPLDPLNMAQQRIRELELELAQTKLAQVEAECKNQDLNHQLNTTLNEIQNNRNSWQPWLSKTINTIQEKVTTRRDLPTFQSYANPNQESIDYKDKILPGNSPKQQQQQQEQQQQQNRNQIQNTQQQQQHRNVSNRNSVDILPKDRPVLRDTLSFTSLK